MTSAALRLLLFAAAASCALAQDAPVPVFSVAGTTYRIPAIVRTPLGTLVAFAERRTGGDCDPKALVARRSVDNGSSWGDEIVLVGGDGTVVAGNPTVVFDDATQTIVLAFASGPPAQCDPSADTFVMDDGGSDGVTWGAPRNVSGALGRYRGALPGPGTGAQVPPPSPHAGRLIFVAHYGAYGEDVVFYSDDHGATWALSPTALPLMDEAAVAVLPNGTLALNMRNEVASAGCHFCRAASLSSDGGATWALPVVYIPVLISPVCQGSFVVTAGALYYSGPDSASSRTNISIHRSDDSGATWDAHVFVANAPASAGYSCLVAGAQPTMVVAGRPYGGILYEVGAAGNEIFYRNFPLDLGNNSSSSSEEKW